MPGPLAHEHRAEAFAPIGVGDCCRSNDAMIFKTGNTHAATPKGCEAGCLSTVACRFFSHSTLYGICVYCSACSLESKRNSKQYTSWRRKAPPALPNASTSEPLVFTMMDRTATALLKTQSFATSAHSTPPWLHRVINLATPTSQRLGAVFNKFRAFANWLDNHPEVDDERLIVFFDGSDSVWGGCDDFVERYLRLERATGDRIRCVYTASALHLRYIRAAPALYCTPTASPLQCAAGARLIMSAEMHCGGSTPTPPGCAGTPNPSPWVAGPMTTQRAMERAPCRKCRLGFVGSAVSLPWPRRADFPGSWPRSALETSR